MIRRSSLRHWSVWDECVTARSDKEGNDTHDEGKHSVTTPRSFVFYHDSSDIFRISSALQFYSVVFIFFFTFVIRFHFLHFLFL